MFRLGLERNGFTHLSRFPTTDKKILEKVADCLNKRFPSRKYVVIEVQESPEPISPNLLKQTDNIRH